MSKIESFFNSSSVVIGDGSLGTMLENHSLSGLPEIHNINRPNLIRNLHISYLACGSKIITTNSFNANGIRLSQYDLGNDLKLLNEKAVLLAKEAIKESRKKAFIAGSIGPTGQMLFPLGDLDIKTAFDSFRLQAKILSESGVDFFIIETMTDLGEVKVVIEAIQSVSALPIAVTMNFSSNLHTIMGVSPQEAIQFISSLGVKLIGANCGNGLNEIEEIMKLMTSNKPNDVILISQPNIGVPFLNREGKTEYQVSDNEIIQYALKMKSLGVRYIGLCCGSTPRHISLIEETLRS